MARCEGSTSPRRERSASGPGSPLTGSSAPGSEPDASRSPRHRVSVESFARSADLSRERQRRGGIRPGLLTDQPPRLASALDRSAFHLGDGGVELVDGRRGDDDEAGEADVGVAVEQCPSRSITSDHSAASDRSASAPRRAFCEASVAYSTLDRRMSRMAVAVGTGVAVIERVLRTPGRKTIACRNDGGASTRGHSLIHSTQE